MQYLYARQKPNTPRAPFATITIKHFRPNFSFYNFRPDMTLLHLYTRIELYAKPIFVIPRPFPPPPPPPPPPSPVSFYNAIFFFWGGGGWLWLAMQYLY